MQDMREIPAIVNEKISDLVHDFMNFNALKIIKEIHKKIKTNPSVTIECKYGNRVPKTKIRRKPNSFELVYTKL